ncbi:MAG: murein biosynthesis integral membrane protein MurJ [Puniceicoccales bacterium]|jgi:putative peptidoglycan lipid II flippase|nr:murein biosynthesis integral membrane protein MurJ [Puniceicoccales bacterium]
MANMVLSRKFCGVSSITAFSRLSGFIRDVVLFATFGTSAISAAFLFAFTLPNLFRKLLGEGALTSALIPIFSQEYHRQDSHAAFALLNRVISRAMLVLIGIVLCGIGLFWRLGRIPGLEDRWYFGFQLAIILLPFTCFICLTALLAAVLNVLEHFFWAATPSLWMNMSMIASLLIVNFFKFEAHVKVYCLSAGVLVGGFIPMLLLVKQLRCQSWVPRWDLSSSPALSELQKLFLPGLGGAAVAQLNLAVSRFLAFSLQTNAISLLYIADRLIDLPLGIFVIAVTTLFFPKMSRSSAICCDEEFFRQSLHGILAVLVISIPAAVGLFLLGRDILLTLFTWGQFRVEDVASALPVLRVFSMALPFYALSTFFTRMYHAKKNMRAPVRASAYAFVINLSLILLLMRHFRVLGIACANALAVMFQAIYLRSQWNSLGVKFPTHVFIKPVAGILVSAASMGGVLAFLLQSGIIGPNISRAHHMASLFGLVFVGMGIYFMILALWDRCWTHIWMPNRPEGLRH